MKNCANIMLQHGMVIFWLKFTSDILDVCQVSHPVRPVSLAPIKVLISASFADFFRTCPNDLLFCFFSAKVEMAH